MDEADKNLKIAKLQNNDFLEANDIAVDSYIADNDESRYDNWAEDDDSIEDNNNAKDDDNNKDDDYLDREIAQLKDEMSELDEETFSAKKQLRENTERARHLEIKLLLAIVEAGMNKARYHR